MPPRNHRPAIAVTIVTLIALAAIIVLPQHARADWRSITGRLPAFVGRVDFKVSPDSRFVAYTADADSDNVTELYAAPLAGGPPLKLNPPLVEGGNVGTFLFTPDSSHVLYLADQEVDERRELWSVPVGGGQAPRLNARLVAGGATFPA